MAERGKGETALRFTVLEDSGDERGSSFPTGAAWVKYLGNIDDAHIMTLLPGRVRGNHYHVDKREVIVVLFSGSWQLAWDEGAETACHTHNFSGTGAVLIEVDPLASHAVANTGDAPIWIIGLSNRVWNPDAPDVRPRPVFPQR